MQPSQARSDSEQGKPQATIQSSPKAIATVDSSKGIAKELKPQTLYGAAKAHAEIINLLAALITLLAFGWTIYKFGRRLLVRFLAWWTSLLEEARPKSGEKPNLVAVTGRVKQIGLSKDFIWGHVDPFDGHFRTAFIAEFANLARNNRRTGGAQNVRARVMLSAPDLSDQGINIDPSPWLNAAYPTMPFGIGESRELIVAVIDYQDFPNLVKDRPGESQDAIFGLKDQRDKAVSEERRYEWAGPILSRRVKATVMLTVDGYAYGPFYFCLEGADPIERSWPKVRAANFNETPILACNV